MIGVLGFDVSNFSYRRILAMWLSHQIDSWNHTAAIRHAIAQSQSTKTIKIEAFHPFTEKQTSNRFTPDDIDIVKGVCSSVFSKTDA